MLKFRAMCYLCHCYGCTNVINCTSWLFMSIYQL